MIENNDSYEINISTLISIFWRNKLLIGIASMLLAILAVAGSFLMPVMYKSEVLVQSVTDDGSMGLGQNLASQFGGIASLAGINLGAETSDEKVVLEVLESRQFILSFVEKHKMMPLLLAVKSWNKDKNEVVFDSEIYLAEKGQWLIEDDKGNYRAPSNQEVYDEFRSRLSVTTDSDSGLHSIYYSHQSPYIAQDVLTKLVVFVNETMSQSDSKEAEARISYLSEKLVDTRVESIRNIFYQLIENELQKKMLIDTRKEYSYKIIDPAYLAEDKSSPKRAYFLIAGFLLGTILALFYLAVRAVIASDDQKQENIG